MKVRVKVDKVAALKAGLDDHGLKVVEVAAASLTPGQRDLLAGYGHAGRQDYPAADFFLDQAPDQPETAQVAGPDTVLALLSTMLAAREAKEAEKRDEYEARVQKWLDKPAEEWLQDTGLRVYVKNRGDGDNWAIPADARLDAKMAEAEELARRLNEEREAQRRAAEAERDREKAARLAEQAERREKLKSWALANGSTLLRARVEEGFEWEGMAEAEFANHATAALGLALGGSHLGPSEAPDGYEVGEDGERATPTLAEIELLRRARQVIKEAAVPAEAELVWTTYKPERGDYDREPLRRVELNVYVTCPNGRPRTVSYVVLANETAKAD